MLQKISVPVSVSLAYDNDKKTVCPRWIIWNKRLYPVIKIGLHHTFREGRILYHVFSVASQNMFFRLVLDTETLHWKLEEIADGLPS